MASQANIDLSETQSSWCEIHDDQHAATYWCIDCEQRMCDDVKAQHAKLRSTAKHHVCPLNQPIPNLQKAILCSHHNRELELACKQDNQIICALCVATTHQGHVCQTIEEHYKTKETELQKLVGEAKNQRGLLKGLESAQKEKNNVITLQQTLEKQVNEFFQKLLKLKKDVANQSTTKIQALEGQAASLSASIDTITTTLGQLEGALAHKHLTQVLVTTKQLQTNLSATQNANISPITYSDLTFSVTVKHELEAQITSHQLQSENITITTLNNDNKPSSMIIEARDFNGNSVALLAGYFTISAFDVGGNQHKIQVVETNSKLEVQIDSQIEEVEVKLKGNHIKGSPIRKFFNCWV